jgi:hypothetical protein
MDEEEEEDICIELLINEDDIDDHQRDSDFPDDELSAGEYNKENEYEI